MPERRLQCVDERKRGLVSIGRIVGERAREHEAQCVRVGAGNVVERQRRVRAGAADTAARDQFVDQRRKAEDVGASIPVGARDAFRRTVGTTHRRHDADVFERLRDSETGDACVVGRQQHIAWMKRAVIHAGRRREVERARQLRGDAQRIRRRCRTVLANRQIERFAGDELVREIRAADAGGERRGNRRMRQVRRDEPLESTDEPAHAVGRELDCEELDGNEPLAFRVITAKHGSECSRTDLMKNTERSERVRGRSAGSFRVQ